jgi:hypothetical protein
MAWIETEEVIALQQDELLAKTFPLILFNDLIGWVPFGMFLWQMGRRKST